MEMSDLSDNPARTYRRKVYAIKKSVYVNIPSKISKEIGIVKGSVMYVTLEGGRVILSKEQDGKEIVKYKEPCQEPEERGNDTSKENSLKRLLEKDYTW